MKTNDTKFNKTSNNKVDRLSGPSKRIILTLILRSRTDLTVHLKKFSIFRTHHSQDRMAQDRFLEEISARRHGWSAQWFFCFDNDRSQPNPLYMYIVGDDVISVLKN